MPGLYIHIPFCKKACHYCDFHFATSLRAKDDLLSALKKEIALQKNYLPSPTLQSVYFGGGTPSLLTRPELNEILDTIALHFTIESGAEITLEANPDDISPASVTDFKQAGINRLSIGIQSFFEEDLAWMNRAHTAQQAETCIDTALQSGIDNITADLIYGYPLLTDEKWEKNIDQLLSSGIQHLSAYSLTIEPKTALAHKIKKGAEKPPMPEHAARHFEMLMAKIAVAGWEHYEISNYCQPGRYAIHNTNYWKNEPYLGIGPSAHSYNGHSRQWNIANNALYIKSINENALPTETEYLSPQDHHNEYIMTGLRTQWGINTAVIAERWGTERGAALQQEMEVFLQNGLIRHDAGTITLTSSGKLLADYIASQLFW